MFAEYNGRYIFGWNGDVYTRTVKQIMNDIQSAIAQTMVKIPWQPDTRGDSPLIRKMKKLIMMEVAFYAKPLYRNYEAMLYEFTKSNAQFKTWIDEHLNMYEKGTGDSSNH
jgi:hypothetical protein